MEKEFESNADRNGRALFVRALFIRARLILLLR